VVADLTTTEFTIRSNVPLPSSAFITVDMPKINPSAPKSLRKSYIDESSLACSSVETVDPALTCTFSNHNKTYDRLTIKNIYPNG
jgi:hypothetical protein